MDKKPMLKEKWENYIFIFYMFLRVISTYNI